MSFQEVQLLEAKVFDRSMQAFCNRDRADLLLYAILKKNTHLKANKSKGALQNHCTASALAFEVSQNICTPVTIKELKFFNYC